MLSAPVTRLRRRFSVDQSDDTKSPSAPSTPTKKRGRLAAKPQLELIDENGKSKALTNRICSSTYSFLNHEIFYFLKKIKEVSEPPT